MSAVQPQLRAGAPVAVQASQFGLLQDLAGTWMGSGFNLISKPGFDVQKPFVLQVNQTTELLEFMPIGGEIPDRGTFQEDINIFALTYRQHVSDPGNGGLLHVERGMWLNVPSSSDPNEPASIARLSTIPHGDSVLAQGTAGKFPGGPEIQPVSVRPIVVATGAPTPPGYFPPDPPAFPQVNPFPIPSGFDLANPNQALVEANQGVTFENVIVLEVSTKPNPDSFTPLPGPADFGGGILNIPFVTRNANALSLEAIFWIETVTTKDRPDPFLRLQYSQRVMLRFPDGPNGQLIDWPHVSVATLTKI